jgi:hypothetical protein
MSATVEQVLALASACLLRNDPAARDQLADLLEEHGLAQEAGQLRHRPAVWLVMYADAEGFDGADVDAYYSEEKALKAAALKGRWQEAVDRYNSFAGLAHCGASVLVISAWLDSPVSESELA